MKEILIAFRIGPVISIHEMYDFQEDLKVVTEDDLENLFSEITETGFAFPPYIWKDPSDDLWKIVDAHQRKKVLILAESRGWSVPHLPTIEVLAKNYEEAKRRVLQATSQYGRMTEKGLAAFSQAAGLKFESLGRFRFPELKMQKVSMHLNPAFTPGSKDEQGELDKKAGEKTVITCPHCGGEFTR